MARVIRRTQQAFNQPIGVVNMDTGADQVGLAFAEAGEQLRRTAFKIDAQEAKRVGEETAAAADLRALDADGKPVALGAPEGFGRIARESYRNVIERRFFEQMDSDIRLKSKELAVKYDRSPLEYDNAMQAYLDGMAKNSEGRFQRFIIDAGTVVKESTHLGLVQAARNRARTQSAEHIIATNTESRSQIAVDARENRFDAVDAHIEQRVQATRDGEGAGLKVGSNIAVKSELSGVAASQYLVTQMTQMNATQRARLLAKLTANHSLPEGGIVDTAYKVVEKYIDANNIDSIVADLNAASGDLDALQRIQDAENTRNEVAARNQMLSEADRNSDSLYYKADQKSSDAFYDRSTSIESAIDSIGSQLQSDILDLEANFGINEQFTAADLEREVTDRIQSAINPFISDAAAQENSEALRSALQSGPTNLESMSQLTEDQQDLVTALHNFDIRIGGESKKLFGGTAEEMAFVSPIISQGSSTRDQQRLDDIAANNLQNDFDALLEDSMRTGFDDEKLQAVLSKAGQNIKPSFLDGLSKRYEFEKTKNLFSQLAFTARGIAKSSLGSAEVDKMVAYIVSNGASQLNEDIASLTDQYLEGMPPKQRSDIASHLRSISTGLKSVEAKDREDQKAIANLQVFNMGVFDRSEVKYQNISQEIVLSLGFDLNNLETLTPDIEKVMKNAPPKFLVEGLENLTSGRPANDQVSQNLMALYTRLSSYTDTDMLGRTTGIKNAFDDVISPANQLMLREMQVGYKNDLYSSFAEASIKVNELRETSASKARDNLNNFLVDKDGKSITPSTYVGQVLDDIDPYLKSEFGIMAKLMIAKGYGPEVVERELKAQYEIRYKPSEYVFDGSRGFNNQGRSRYSLDSVVSSAEQKGFVINTIDQELQDIGLTLYNHNNNTTISHQDFFERAVLVPIFNDVRPDQQIYQVMKVVESEDGYKELTPVITEDGIVAGYSVAEIMKDAPEQIQSLGKSYEELAAELQRQQETGDVATFGKANLPVAIGFGLVQRLSGLKDRGIMQSPDVQKIMGLFGND